MTTRSDTAAATMPATGAVTPNLFTFMGRQCDVQVVWSTTSITGKPQLSYHDATRDVSATGDEISVERGPLGTLVTITIETVPDLHTVTATLAVPDLGGRSDPITRFRTFVVLTTNRASIGGPGPGHRPAAAVHGREGPGHRAAGRLLTGLLRVRSAWAACERDVAAVAGAGPSRSTGDARGPPGYVTACQARRGREGGHMGNHLIATWDGAGTSSRHSGSPARSSSAATTSGSWGTTRSPSGAATWAPASSRGAGAWSGRRALRVTPWPRWRC
jgi:hypothetical protein